MSRLQLQEHEHSKMETKILSLQLQMSARALGLRPRADETIPEFCQRRFRTARQLRDHLQIPAWHVEIQIRSWRLARNVACAPQLSFGRRVHEWRPLWWQQATRFLMPRMGCGGGVGRMRPGRPIRWEARIHNFWNPLGVAWTELDEWESWQAAEMAFKDSLVAL